MLLRCVNAHGCGLSEVAAELLDDEVGCRPTEFGDWMRRKIERE